MVSQWVENERNRFVVIFFLGFAVLINVMLVGGSKNVIPSPVPVVSFSKCYVVPVSVVSSANFLPHFVVSSLSLSSRVRSFPLGNRGKQGVRKRGSFPSAFIEFLLHDGCLESFENTCGIMRR